MLHVLPNRFVPYEPLLRRLDQYTSIPISVYVPGLIPEGVAEADLFIAYYDVATGQWVSLPSAVDTENNTITAEVSHLTKFAILTAPAGIAPFNIWLVFGPILSVLAVAGLAFYFLMRGGLIRRRRTGMAR